MICSLLLNDVFKHVDYKLVDMLHKVDKLLMSHAVPFRRGCDVGTVQVLAFGGRGVGLSVSGCIICRAYPFFDMLICCLFLHFRGINGMCAFRVDTLKDEEPHITGPMYGPWLPDVPDAVLSLARNGVVMVAGEGWGVVQNAPLRFV